MKKLFFITIIATALFSISCQKDMGGNADVSSIEFVVLTSDWFPIGTEGTPGYGFAVDLDFPEITDNVVQNGMATLYIKTGDAWAPVPLYYYKDGYQGGYLCMMQRGVFSIEYYESDHLTVRPETHVFKLVIVQPI